MKKFQNIFILMSVIFFSCQKNITIPQPHYDSKVSIQSLIEPDSVPKVFFNYTVPFFDAKIVNAQLVIRNTTVKISGDSKTDILHLDSIYDKVLCDYIFWYEGIIPIANNITYTLSIDYNNENYSATATTNLLAVTIDSVGYVQKFNDVYGEHEGVLTYFKDAPSQINFYRYEMLRPVDASMKHASIALTTACLGSDTIQYLEFGRSVYTDENLDGQPIKLITEPAFTHRDSLETLVRVQTIDKNAYNFLDQLDRQKLGVYNPFVEPVFLTQGQFGAKAIGFFSAMKRSTPHAFTFPE